MLIISTTALVLGLVLQAVASEPPTTDVDSTPQPIFKDGALTVEQLEGVWRILGYGLLIEFEPGGIRTFAECSAGTWETDADDLFEVERMHVGTRADSSAFELYTESSEAPYALEKLERLPEDLRAGGDWSHAELLDAFIATFDEHYPFFEARSFDWPTRVRQARAALTETTTEAGLFKLMTDALEGLGDGHVYLEAEIDGEEFELEGAPPKIFRRALAEASEGSDVELTDKEVAVVRREQITAIREGILLRLLRGEPEVAIDRFPWGRLEGDVGYILITGMGIDDDMPLVEQLPAIHGAFDEMLKGLGDIRALVIDVSLNGGGFDAVSLAMASHFTERAGVVYTKAPAQHPELAREIRLEPWDGLRFTGPTFVVSSDQTASAAEIFQLAMGAQPHVTLIGAPGSACFSDVIPRRLPNGWLLCLGPEVYRDVEGVCHEGRGVPLDIEFPIFDGADRLTSHVEALEEIVELARKSR